MSEEYIWSCDDKDSRGNCRNPHGCHCREITELVRERDQLLAKLKKRNTRAGEKA